MIKAAKRMHGMSALFYHSRAEKINSLLRAGKDVISLDVGSPDMPPHKSILDALYRSAASSSSHGYQSQKATQAFREAWNKTYQRIFSVDLDSENEIMPLLGSKEGIFHLMQAIIDPGDVVIIPDPSYPTYARGTIFAGGEPFFSPLNEENDYIPNLEAIPEEIASKAKVMWINYPNNPTSATTSASFFADVIDFANEYGILVCHDAAYSQVVYEQYVAPSILSVPGAKNVAIEFNSLSKSHNMAGWRVGVAIGNPDVLQVLLDLKTNADSGHFRPIWDAATFALTSDQDWLMERNAIYQRRRDIIIRGLQGIGLHPFIPQASLYIWCPIPAGWISLDFSEALLDQAYVSVVPGTVFGAHGEGYIRISLTAPDDRIGEAMQRIEVFWDNLTTS